MFVLDVQDFRKGSSCEVSLVEAQVASALTDAGIDFNEKPLELRVRVKDMDHRRLMVKSEPIDSDGLVFRLNVYVMPGVSEVSEKVLAKFNRRIRHELKHMAQYREAGGITTVEEAVGREHAAYVYEQEGSAEFFATS